MYRTNARVIAKITEIKYSFIEKIKIFFKKMIYKLYPTKQNYLNYVKACLEGKIGDD